MAGVNWWSWAHSPRPPGAPRLIILTQSFSSSSANQRTLHKLILSLQHSPLPGFWKCFAETLALMPIHLIFLSLWQKESSIFVLIVRLEKLSFLDDNTHTHTHTHTHTPLLGLLEHELPILAWQCNKPFSAPDSDLIFFGLTVHQTHELRSTPVVRVIHSALGKSKCEGQVEHA